MKNSDDFDLESILREHNHQQIRDDIDFYRSGSAPPTVEGSRAAFRSLLGHIEDDESREFLNSEEDLLRKHPEYLLQYYGNGNLNLNPRNPMPLINKEDWRTAQRIRNIRSGENSSFSSSLFAVQPGLEKEDFGGLGGRRRKSFADVIQEDPIHLPPISPHPSRPVSRNAYGASNDIKLAQIRDMDALRSAATSPSLARVQSIGSTMSQSFASAVVGPSHSRSTTPDPHIIARPTSRGPLVDLDNMAAALSGLNLSNNMKVDGESQLYNNMNNDQNNYLQQKLMVKPVPESVSLLPNNGFSNNTGAASVSNGQFVFQEHPTSRNLSKQATLMGLNSFMGSSGNNLTDIANVDFVGNSSNSFQTPPAMLNNHLDEGLGMPIGPQGQYLSRTNNRVGSTYQTPIIDPLYARAPYLNANQMDMSAYKAYLATLLAQQRMAQEGSYIGKAGALNNGLYGNSVVDLRMQHPTLIPGGTLRHNDMLSRLPSAVLRSGIGSKGSWNHVNGVMEQGFASTKLEEFKTNKARSFELSEIADHVVEFSGDQYGSRFIQQKLEIASDGEKNILFPQILAHARVLMTDVFGNYVIQKFFEHGTECQRSQLASQLMGHVLALSLQMYGCRVIQKALEVVNVDQQTQMVSELDGAIMKCVRDQNGNHVIQKCIECVPEDRIQFIISSFYGQVVTLSTHPYGCRVIQRVLEHCTDAKTQSVMMDEIMRSVCNLAQDQYGNYVIQHVLQHGKQEERAAIISKLAGQIVKMSQQKFASNVVEKCLTFGTASERQILIDEMLGTTDENEPLQAMMKDQFGNYVVQKVLETCDDQNRELILSRIKVHLNALKRYTYGKHIVARVEKLITAGERRIGLSSYGT